MNEKITLPDGREVKVGTDNLGSLIEDVLLALGALEKVMDYDSDVRFLLRKLYDQAYDTLMDIANAIERSVGKIEITYAGDTAWKPFILDARLVPKEVQS